MSLKRMMMGLYKVGTEARPLSSYNRSLREEQVYGYANFWERIAQDENDVTKQPLIVIFKADDISHGVSWCPDCNDFEEKLRELRREHTPVGFHLRVNVGSREVWKNPRNPFRTDHRLHISSVPTLIVWKTGRRISGHHTVNLEELRSFFMDHD